MGRVTKQMQVWHGNFGKEYTRRNLLSPEEMDALYIHNYGITRSAMNEKFLSGLDVRMRILEVGCNVGTQLMLLQKMGYQNLYGIELQAHAVELGKQRTRNINMIQGSAFGIPFRDGFFDVVFTSGVLIHIAPGDIASGLDEIHRCSREFIWGFEYYCEQHTGVHYREHDDLLWKGDFSGFYLKRYPALELVREEKFRYLTNHNVDVMFLLKKK